MIYRNPVKIFVLISLLSILNGCLGNKLVHVSLEKRDVLTQKLNSAAKGREARIASINGDTLQVKDITVYEDSVFWQHKETGQIAGTALSEIRTISLVKRNTVKGFAHGFLVGTGLGIGLTSLVILAPPPKGPDCGGKALCFVKGVTFGAVVFGIPAGFLGMYAGARTKTTDTYDFDDKEIRGVK